MNPRIIVILTITALAILLICGIAGTSYFMGVYQPTQVAVAADKQQTQAAGQATSIFLTEVGKTEVVVAVGYTQAAAQAATRTQAAIPTATVTPSITPTPIPTLPPTATFTPIPTFTPTSAAPAVVCDARVRGTTRSMYPWPDQGQFFSRTDVASNTTLQVTGRLADSSWYQVIYNGHPGWMRSNTLEIIGACQPNQYDLHYLQGWLGAADQIVVDDTFSQGKYEWYTSTGQNIRTEYGTDGEGQLRFSGGEEPVVVSTSLLQTGTLSAFAMHGAFTIADSNTNSFVGVRFRDNGDSYYQVQLNVGSGSCRVELYADTERIHLVEMQPAVCYSRIYDFAISVTDDYKLQLDVNGYSIINGYNLPDPNSIYTAGNIGLVTRSSTAILDYLVISVPNP